MTRSQTSNGISAQEAGQLQQARSAESSPAYAVQGQFSYTGPDGLVYTIKYTADENGYHPEGLCSLFTSFFLLSFRILNLSKPELNELIRSFVHFRCPYPTRLN